MYYVIVPSELCERRRVFTRNPRTGDGRVVLTMRDLNLIHFSLGVVEVVNETDLAEMDVTVPELSGGEINDGADSNGDSNGESESDGEGDGELQPEVEITNE